MAVITNNSFLNPSLRFSFLVCNPFLMHKIKSCLHLFLFTRVLFDREVKCCVDRLDWRLIVWDWRVIFHTQHHQLFYFCSSNKKRNQSRITLISLQEKQSESVPLYDACAGLFANVNAIASYYLHFYKQISTFSSFVHVILNCIELKKFA